MSKRKHSSNFYRRVKACTDNDIVVINEECSFMSDDYGEREKSADYSSDLPSSNCESDVNDINENENPENNFIPGEDNFALNNAGAGKKATIGIDSVCIPQQSNNSEFKTGLKSWAVKNRIPQKATTELLKLLKTLPLEMNLPSDARTLLSTPRTTNIRKVSPGEYSHFGLAEAVGELCKNVNVERIELLVNIDGLPISKSSGSQIYPILCALHGHPEVAVIGIYHGYAKPDCANEFLKDFVKDVVEMSENGFLLDESTNIPIEIKGLICDAPAKSFIMFTKGHTGYYSCTKCLQKGKYLKGRMCFPKINSEKRTHDNFSMRYQESHHTGISILENIPRFDMVSNVPLEYMHLICLGVVKKLLVTLWLHGKPPNKLKPDVIQSISSLHASFKKNTPSEFVRKPRSLDEVKRWKATEFRYFLLYSGPVVLKTFLSEDKYMNFLSLHIAVRILASKNSNEYHDFAHSLLIYFVQNFGEIYGHEFISHNIHGLIHVREDVQIFGHLDLYSAFPFENYLQILKKMIRKFENPLAQIMRRLTEKRHIRKSKLLEDTEFLCSDEHFDGSQPEGLQFSKQYKTIKSKSYKLKINSDSNCYCSLKDNSIIKILNIALKPSNEVCIVGKKFLNPQLFFERPCESSVLGIFFVNDLGPLSIWPISEICNKYILLPHLNGFVAFPLIHTYEIQISQ